MTGVTDPDLLPYGLQTDFGDVQQFFELAMKVDRIAQAADQAFNTVYRPKAFVVRGSAQVSLGSGTLGTALNSYWNTVDWNTSSAAQLPGNGVDFSFHQDPGEPPSWWMLGADIPLANTSGTAVVGTHTSLRFVAESADPVTGVYKVLADDGTNAGSGRYTGLRINVESNSGGELMSTVTVVPLYQGIAWLNVNVDIAAGDTAVRAVAPNGCFWGIRLGEVFL